MSDEGLREMVLALQRDLEQYAQHIAGVSCPPECKHFNLFDDSKQMGCELPEASPFDCLDATAGDIARWLISRGWRPPLLASRAPLAPLVLPDPPAEEPKPRWCKVVRVRAQKLPEEVPVVRVAVVRKLKRQTPHCAED